VAETRLLVIDDEPEICEVLTEVFEDRGYMVATAGTGGEAIELTKETVFDVALIDIGLPDTDGTTLLKEIKKMHPETACIIITGHASLQNTIKVFRDGASGYFVKPLVIEEVVHGVNEAIEKKRLKQERREAEEKIKKYAEELEEANRLKDTFIDIMTHDLLGPAGMIMNSAQFLLATAKGEEQEFLEIIEMGAKKQVEIVELTSQLSKLKSSDELECEELDLKEIIEKAIEATAHLFSEAGMEVENNINASIRIRANPVIEDIFSNLLSNAVKYAPEGKRVIIDARDEGESCTVSITDFGPGISDEGKKDIFERFKRWKRESVRGTGLGLAIVKSMAELHGGSVWVEDNPEGGSVFFVELPKNG
jgi:signal transduction histidine kinase